MPKHSGRAAIVGLDGRRERPASGHGHPRAGAFHSDVAVPSRRRADSPAGDDGWPPGAEVPGPRRSPLGEGSQ
jgi:hypothetical protein